MAHPSRKFWTAALCVLAITGLLTGTLVPLTTLPKAQAATPRGGTTPPYIKGPFIDQPVYPTVFNGDLRDLVKQQPAGGGDLPAPRTVKQPSLGIVSGPKAWIDPVAQATPAKGQMPDPIMNFEGLDVVDGGGWHPPDTNGDVGPNHYIETVNIAIGIYDKYTGEELVNLPYNTFFQGPIGSPCDTQNRGDVVVLYDAQVDRWIVTDFSLPSTGAVYECIAVSQSGDPVEGGWYFYAMETDPDGSPWHDYPKLGVWADGWYMSANMFDPWSGVWVWALDRNAMINGETWEPIRFETGTAYGSLLPGNLRGDLPPAGAPEYFASIQFPNILNLWQFHVDWDNPGNSTFTLLDPLTVADFEYIDSIPQQGVGQQLDSLGDRLMMQLQYRNINGVEALYVNHTVLSGGVAGVRWYEVRDPNGTPFIFQQGTYQPDANYRWMGSIAADGEGNLALGYSVSSSSIYPSIRYTGRLAGETPGLMTQNEASLIEGTGSQVGSNRWGDYSAMTIDPVDDCTFWYTQEYLSITSGNWRTRIGSFKFPSCGQPKGTVSGYVYNSVTNQPVANVPLFVQGTDYSFSTLTDGSGHYSIDLLAGSYDMTAGPLLPGYPGTDFVAGVEVSTGMTTNQDFYLDPVPFLADAGIQLNDNVLYGNNNGYAEPGERGLLLTEDLFNQGGITATQIIANLTSLTPGVTVDTADSTYPNIAAGDTASNTTPYVFSIDPGLTCGTDLNFQAVITDNVHTYNTSFSLNASVPLPPQNIFFNDVESGLMDWSTGGSPNTWAITTEDAHSPTHSWTDSPGGNYLNNADNWVRTPAFDLSEVQNVQLSGWFTYSLESGYDFVYVEYSLDGGNYWNPNPLVTFNGAANWHEVTIDASVLDGQPNVALRFHFTSDVGVVADGIHMDDLALFYEPYECTYTPIPPDAPALIAPLNGSSVTSPVYFEWQASGTGMPTTGYILFLDDAPVMTYTTPVTNTTLDVPLGPHSWFLKATNHFGSSGPSATWNFTVIVNPPDEFSKTAPADGAVGVPITPTLSWESSTGAMSYDYCYDTTPGDTCEGSWTSTDMNTSVDLSGLDYGTTYYWQVRAINEGGETEANGGAWWSFTTIVAAPADFAKLAPANGALSVPTNPTLSWESSGGAASYQYCLDNTDDNICDGEWIDTGTETSIALDGLTNGMTYYWQVKASNDGGDTDANGGTWWSFTTIISAPAAFGKLEPANGALSVQTNPTLSWESSSGATSYKYCIDTTDDSSCDGDWIDAGTGTSIALEGLTNGTTYFWQVQALNEGGETFANENTWWSFTTLVNAPGAFSKIEPANGAVGIATNPTLSWESSVGATSYLYCIDFTNDDTCDGTWTDAGTETSVALVGLTVGNPYYWQVQAINPGGNTLANGGSWWRFEVIFKTSLPIVIK